MSKIRQWIQRYRKLLSAIVLWGSLLLLLRQYMTANDLKIADLMSQLQTLLTGTWYGPLLYIFVYLLRPLFLLPASWMTALAGTVFGLGLGFIYALVAGTLSCVFPYGVGRWALGDTKGKVAGGAFSRLQNFFNTIQRNPFRTILTMRLLYLPYDAVSVFAGSLKINFVPFILATTLGNIGGTFAYVALGASVEGDLTANSLRFDPVIVLISVVVFAISMLASWLLKRKSAIIDDEASTENHDYEFKYTSMEKSVS